MIATFGEPVRGISMYATELFSALEAAAAIPLSRIDYRRLYPEFLFPGGREARSESPDALLHWARPGTWRKAAEMSAPILHIQYWSPVTAPMLLSVARSARARGKAVIVTVHNPEPHEHLPGFRRIERALLRTAHMLVTHTAAGEQRLRGVVRSEVPVVTIPHGVYIRGSSAPSQDDYALLGLDPAKRYVVTFGNLRGYKGVPTLLRAWRRVSAAIGQVDLVIAGRTWRGGHSHSARLAARVLGAASAGRDIERLLSQEPLTSRVALIDGFIPDRSLDALCRIADLGVFAYDRMSGQSGAAARAAGSGLPLVVSSVGGLHEYAIGSDHIVAPGDHEALADRLIRHLNSRAEARRQMRERQLAHAGSFAWQRVADEHLAAYSRVHGLLRGDARDRKAEPSSPGR